MSGGMTPDRDEHVLADVKAPLREMVFPFLEMIVVTGVLWIIIGWFDAADAGRYGVGPLHLPPEWRNGFVLLWAVLVLWRFLLPLLRKRRRRMIVTDRRIIFRGDGFRARPRTLSMSAVTWAEKERGLLAVYLRDSDVPVCYRGLPKVRRIARIINDPHL